MHAAGVESNKPILGPCWLMGPARPDSDAALLFASSVFLFREKN